MGVSQVLGRSTVEARARNREERKSKSSRRGVQLLMFIFNRDGVLVRGRLEGAAVWRGGEAKAGPDRREMNLFWDASYRASSSPALQSLQSRR